MIAWNESSLAPLRTEVREGHPLILLISVLDPLGNPGKEFHFMSSSHWNHLLGSILTYSFSNTVEAALVIDFICFALFLVTGES